MSTLRVHYAIVLHTVVEVVFSYILYYYSSMYVVLLRKNEKLITPKGLCYVLQIKSGTSVNA